MYKYKVSIGSGYETSASNPYSAITKVVSHARIYQPRAIRKLAIGEHMIISVTRLPNTP